MYSRRGKSTIDIYKCFQVDPEEQMKIRHEMKLKLLFGYKQTDSEAEEEEERKFVEAFINNYEEGKQEGWVPGMDLEMQTNNK
jgi:hypothetical protein